MQKMLQLSHSQVKVYKVRTYKTNSFCASFKEIPRNCGILVTYTPHPLSPSQVIRFCEQHIHCKTCYWWIYVYFRVFTDHERFLSAKYTTIFYPLFTSLKLSNENVYVLASFCALSQRLTKSNTPGLQLRGTTVVLFSASADKRHEKIELASKT